MRAEFDDNAGLSPEQKNALAAYAVSLLDRGWCAPDINDSTEVVQVRLSRLENKGQYLDVNGVGVHFSGGHMWQKSPTRALTEPMDVLPGGIYPISRLRGTRKAAILDVVQFKA